MFKTVAGYLDQHNSIWSGMAPLASAAQEFEDMIRAIEAAAQRSEIPGAARGEKAAARDSLEEVLFLTCSALGVLGHNSRDHELSALTAVSASGLGRLTTEELANRALTVLEKANERKTDLVALQVTQANLDELQEAVVRFKALVEKPRMERVNRSTQFASLPDLVRETSGILRERIDRMVNLFSRTHPDFFSGYRIARVVIDRRGGHSGPQAVTPPETGASAN